MRWRRQRRQARQNQGAGQRDGRTDKAVVIFIGRIADGAVLRACLRLSDGCAGYTGEITQMDVAERQHKLQRQRKQRQAATNPAIGSNPAHVRRYDLPTTY